MNLLIRFNIKLFDLCHFVPFSANFFAIATPFLTFLSVILFFSEFSI